jgi:membrane protease YdiL (CAAX protease family)
MMGAWYLGAELLAIFLVFLSSLIPANIFNAINQFSGSVTLYALGLPALLLVSLGIRAEKPSSKQSFGFGAFMFAICAAFTAMVAGSMIGTQIDSILTLLFGGSTDIVGEMMDISSPLAFLSTFVLSVVCAPLFEELIFRRILIPRLLPYGEGMAIFTSALLFGLMHGNFQQFFYATLFGIVLGYVYVRSGKWMLCVALHAFFNLIGGIVPMVITDILFPESLTSALDALLAGQFSEELLASLAEGWLPLLLLLLYDLIVYGAAIVGLILLIVKRKRIHLEPTSAPLPRNYKKGPTFGNPGIIFALCLCGTLFLISTLVYYLPA